MAVEWGNDGERRCGFCGRKLPARRGSGRPAKFCSEGCRRAKWRYRYGAQLLDDTVDLIASAEDQALRGALAAIAPGALLTLRTSLSDAAGGKRRNRDEIPDAG